MGDCLERPFYTGFLLSKVRQGLRNSNRSVMVGPAVGSCGSFPASCAMQDEWVKPCFGLAHKGFRWHDLRHDCIQAKRGWVFRRSFLAGNVWTSPCARVLSRNSDEARHAKNDSQIFERMPQHVSLTPMLAQTESRLRFIARAAPGQTLIWAVGGKWSTCPGPRWPFRTRAERLRVNHEL